MRATADREERLANVVVALMADSQAAVLVEPGAHALDDPSFLSEPGPVCCRAFGDPRLDVAARRGTRGINGRIRSHSSKRVSSAMCSQLPVDDVEAQAAIRQRPTGPF